MFTALIIAAAAVCYARIGYAVGRASLDVWIKDDNESIRSFLLFPSSHARGTIGTGGSPVCEFTGNGDDRGFYIAGQIIGWPIKLIWNVPAIAALSAFKLIKLRRAPKPLPAPPPRKALTTGTSVQQMATLLDERKRIETEIDARRQEILAEIETEEIANPEIRKVLEEGIKR